MLDEFTELKRGILLTDCKFDHRTYLESRSDIFFVYFIDLDLYSHTFVVRPAISFILLDYLVLKNIAHLFNISAWPIFRLEALLVEQETKYFELIVILENLS